MITLGIDPDTKNTGIALVRAIDPTLASRAKFKVLQVGVATVDAKLSVAQRLIEMSQSISFAARVMDTRFRSVNRISVEGQDAYAGSKQHKRPNDLIHLAVVAGMATGVAQEVFRIFTTPDLWIPKPAEWKGQVEKKAHQRRILASVGLTEKLEGIPGAAGMTATQRGHVIDAIGLAVWVAKRPERRKTA